MKHNYNDVWTPAYMMGPNCMLLLDEMAERCPDAFSGARVLDLGCGQGLSTLYLARETEAREIFATDLWISATDLFRNLNDWGIAEKAVPIHADATDLPYANGFFDCLVSVDAYHYFGRDPHFFSDKIWPLIAPGGTVMISVPGRREGLNAAPALMSEWAGDEADFFQDTVFWRETLCAELSDLASCTVFESERFDAAWNSWFTSGHEYARQDKAFFDRGLGEYLSFVSVILKKR